MAELGCGSRFSYDADYARPYSAQAVAGTDQHSLLYSFAWVHSVLRKRDIPSCSRLIQEVSSVMLITAVALVVIYFFSRGGVKHELTGQPYTMDTPLISILITAPVACLVTLWHLLRGKEPKVCRDCHTRYGNVIEHGFPGLLFRKEWRYQTSLRLFCCRCF